MSLPRSVVIARSFTSTTIFVLEIILLDGKQLVTMRLWLRLRASHCDHLVLDPGLVVYKVYNGYWFFGRPTVEDLRQDLRAVIRKSRPDWDITQPELKDAWRESRKERPDP
jgi:hypothetical protein